MNTPASCSVQVQRAQPGFQLLSQKKVDLTPATVIVGIGASMAVT